MAIPAGAIHHVISGRMPGGEKFAFGYWCDGTGKVSTQLDLDKQSGWAALGIKNQLVGSSFQPAWNSGVVFDTVSSYYYGAGGNVATLQSVSVVNKGGSGSGTQLPNQLAIVASLHTATPGRSYRGRMYLPAVNSLQLGNDGQLGSGFVDALCAGVASMLGAQSHGDSTTGLPGTPVVIVSRKLGVMTPVTAVVMDSRLDIQRSRANKQTVNETFTASLS